LQLLRHIAKKSERGSKEVQGKEELEDTL